MAAVAAVVGALPQLFVPAPVRMGTFAVLAMPVLLRECGLLRFPVPENRRLVPEDVQHLRRWGALQFGFELGTGMRTYSPSALPHLALAAVVLVVPLPAAFVLAAGFAAGRLAMPLLSNAWERRRRLDGRVGAGRPAAAGPRLRRRDRRWHARAVRTP